MSEAPRQSQPPPLRRPGLWTALGWALVAAVVAGSLLTLPATPPVPGSDKTLHLVAYGTLMYWWGMAQPHRRLLWLALLPLLGAGLEGLQALTPARQMEWGDAVANTLGVGLGRMLLETPAGRLLAWFDARLGDRRDARRP